MIITLFSPSSAVFAQQEVLPSLAATDTIAGYSSTVKAFDITPGSEVIFRIKKPDGRIVEIEESANDDGVAELAVSGFHTKKTGKYAVRALINGNRINPSADTSFQVYADSVSPDDSRIRVLRDSAAADGIDSSKIQVQLRDKHKNPISRHFLELISSRKKDEISAKGTGATDEFGEMSFLVKSQQKGISHFSVLDRNSGVILSDRVEVVFFQSDRSSRYSADLFNTQSVFPDIPVEGDIGEFGVIDHFLVEIGSSTGDNLLKESFTMTVTAQDSEDRTVRNYTGGIIILADNDVSIPNKGRQIDFRIEDQGVMVFDLAIKFPETGEYTIKVTEFEEGAFSDIVGEGTVEVVDTCTGLGCGDEIEEPLPSEGDFFQIDRPNDGSTYGSRNVTVKGKIDSDRDVLVYLDNVLIKTISPDADGAFFDDTNIRVEEDGLHDIYFEEVETERRSNTISFSVDTKPPEVIHYEVQPLGEVLPGTMMTITAISEAGLDSVSLDLKNTDVLAEDTSIFQKMEEDTESLGKYMATIRAPEQPGKYSLNLTLVDPFQNTQNAQNLKIIDIQSPQPKISPPRNFTFENTEGNEVRLSWNTPEFPGAGIDAFILSRGVDEFFLMPYDELASNILEQTITGLERNVDHFFALRVRDIDGNESESSEVITIRIDKKEPPPVVDDEDPIVTPVTPPPEIVDIQIEGEVLVTPLNGEIRLEWSDPDLETSFFDIRFGIDQGMYSERFAVQGNIRTATIPDLINGVSYYVTVVPLDANGAPTTQRYSEQRVTPVFDGVHPAPPVLTTTPPPVVQHEPPENLSKIRELDKDGPEFWYLALLSFFFSCSMFFFHRAFRS